MFIFSSEMVASGTISRGRPKAMQKMDRTDKTTSHCFSVLLSAAKGIKQKINKQFPRGILMDGGGFWKSFGVISEKRSKMVDGDLERKNYFC